ncbi:division plane positioning ATPase MipZ [Hyphomicrobium sp.]|uniref:nucleotide-binding protein n=1 Tax=Hyphomicrobium sp. TaxID=82 RepID=UPI0035635916
MVGFGGQKGGSGKTTSATGMAVMAAKHGLKVMLGDLDLIQRSAVEWGERRAASGIKPAIEVRAMTPEAIAKTRELVELLVLDLPGRADKITYDVAKQADLLVVVTDANLLELSPTVHLLHALKDVDIKSPRVVVALTKVRDADREQEARKYLKEAGYPALRDALPDYVSIHDIANDGSAAPDISQPPVAEQVKRFFTGIMKALERATEPTQEASLQKSKEREKQGRGRER